MTPPEGEADSSNTREGDSLNCSKESCKSENLEENWISFDAEPNTTSEKCDKESEISRMVRARKSEKVVSDRTSKEAKRIAEEDEMYCSDEENERPVNWNPTKTRSICEKFGRENEWSGQFSCDKCHSDFSESHLYERHLSEGCLSFSCPDRSSILSDSVDIAEHKSFAHGTNGEASVEDRTPLRKVRHSSSDKSERCKKYYEQLKTERKYRCEVCRKTFITSGHLNTHMHRHSDVKWNCEGCGKNFSCERSLIRHKDTFPGEHWFPCKYCDMTFFRRINITKHMEIKHPEVVMDSKTETALSHRVGEKAFFVADCRLSCRSCPKIFSSEESLLIHSKATHSEEKERTDESKERTENEDAAGDTKYSCERCGKKFVSLEGFEYHKNHWHTEKKAKMNRKKKKRKEKPENEEEEEVPVSRELESNFSCKLCSVSFSLKSALQNHLKLHHVTKNVEVKSGSHRCCICPRSFTSSDGLKYHLATHTGERRYSCNECGKKFIKKTHLSEHVATHSQIKYFKCPRCPRTFSTHSAYRKHVKHFPGPHSFPCSNCGKLFTKESMIEKHMCVDLVKITMAPEVKALLSEDMIEEYFCLAEEQMVEEMTVEAQDPRKKPQDSASRSCYKCFKVFPNLISLQAHQTEHIGKQNYQCRFCPESFKRADAFGAHIRNHLGSTPYMCLKCNRKFISPFTLSMHAKNYPGDHSFTCHKCSRWFPSEKRLEKHECILQNSDCFACACGSNFSSWNQLLEHAGSKPYKCCSCQLKYPTLMGLVRHIKKHTGVKPFSCEICGKSFRAKNNYLNHKNVHADVKEIICQHCDYKSKSQKRMDFHLFRKHDIGSNTAKSTLCSICGIIFPHMSHMKRHFESEHRNELMLEEGGGEKKSLPAELCTLCGKMLNNKYTLANHMKKVHDPNASREERKIKCEFCEEKFHTLKKLQRHVEVHEAPGLRTCEICRKEFYLAKEFRKHMRKHDTNKPFSCLKCGKHFKVSVSLKYHSTICGNAVHRASDGGRKRKIEEISGNGELLYGHIDPVARLGDQECIIHIYET